MTGDGQSRGNAIFWLAAACVLFTILGWALGRFWPY